MSAQLQPHIRIEFEWLVVHDLEDEWQLAHGCVAPQPAEPRPAHIDDEDDWWPGRCMV